MRSSRRRCPQRPLTAGGCGPGRRRYRTYINTVVLSQPRAHVVGPDLSRGLVVADSMRPGGGGRPPAWAHTSPASYSAATWRERWHEHQYGTIGIWRPTDARVSRIASASHAKNPPMTASSRLLALPWQYCTNPMPANIAPAPADAHPISCSNETREDRSPTIAQKSPHDAKRLPTVIWLGNSPPRDSKLSGDGCAPRDDIQPPSGNAPDSGCQSWLSIHPTLPALLGRWCDGDIALSWRHVTHRSVGGTGAAI
jgi:hypothetical protein